MNLSQVETQAVDCPIAACWLVMLVFSLKLKRNYFYWTHLDTTRSLPTCSDIGGAGKTKRVRVQSLRVTFWGATRQKKIVAQWTHINNGNKPSIACALKTSKPYNWKYHSTPSPFLVSWFQCKFASFPEERTVRPSFRTCELSSQKPYLFNQAQ